MEYIEKHHHYIKVAQKYESFTSNKKRVFNPLNTLFIIRLNFLILFV